MRLIIILRQDRALSVTVLSASLALDAKSHFCGTTHLIGARIRMVVHFVMKKIRTP